MDRTSNLRIAADADGGAEQAIAGSAASQTQAKADPAPAQPEPAAPGNQHRRKRGLFLAVIDDRTNDKEHAETDKQKRASEESVSRRL